jgi:hypothetical protein
LRSAVLRRPESDPAAAWQALAAAGVTHAVVHEGFYKDHRGKSVSQWLSTHGARLVAEFDGDRVFALK